MSRADIAGTSRLNVRNRGSLFVGFMCEPHRSLSLPRSVLLLPKRPSHSLQPIEQPWLNQRKFWPTSQMRVPLWQLPPQHVYCHGVRMQESFPNFPPSHCGRFRSTVLRVVGDSNWTWASAPPVNDSMRNSAVLSVIDPHATKKTATP